MQRKDLDLNFLLNPITGDINIKRGEEAVKQSLKTLILTSIYEKPFNSELGANINAFLFANYVIGTDEKIAERIKFIIKKYEPGIKLKSVIVRGADSNTLSVTIEYFYTEDVLNNLMITMERRR